jgi:hypothetical protein
LPLAVRPARSMAPVRSRIDSRRVVLPLWKGPTMAMHRGPPFDLPLNAMSFCLLPPVRVLRRVTRMVCPSAAEGKRVCE